MPYFVQSMEYEKPEPGHKLCAQLGLVTLQQNVRDGTFAVRYGAQVHFRLNYTDAASEFGSCVMHEAACNGTLDNEAR